MVNSYEAELNIENPKRGVSTPTGNAAWYPFYPGFSYKFSKELIKSADLMSGAIVLDPWNGSGTTTSVAVELGHRAIGLDLNPVMVVTAKARLLSHGEKPSLRPIANAIVRIIDESVDTNAYQPDPLLEWFVPNSAQRVRALEMAVQKLLVDSQEYKPWRLRCYEQDLSELCAFFYLVVFRTVRQLLGDRYTSNPTWIKRSKELDRANPTTNIIVALWRILWVAVKM